MSTPVPTLFISKPTFSYGLTHESLAFFVIAESLLEKKYGMISPGPFREILSLGQRTRPRPQNSSPLIPYRLHPSDVSLTLPKAGSLPRAVVFLSPVLVLWEKLFKPGSPLFRQDFRLVAVIGTSPWKVYFSMMLPFFGFAAFPFLG